MVERTLLNAQVVRLLYLIRKCFLRRTRNFFVFLIPIRSDLTQFTIFGSCGLLQIEKETLIKRQFVNKEHRLKYSNVMIKYLMKTSCLK